MQLSNSYCRVGFKIFNYLIARGADIFQKWTCLYLWFERPYLTNHVRCLVGFYECVLEAFYSLEEFWTCAFVAVLFALQNWSDWQPWHHMYHLSSSSLPSIRTWDQLIGHTLTGKRAHRKIEWLNRVRGYWINQFDSWWNSTGHSEEAGKLRDYKSMFAEKIHCQHWLLSYIDCVNRQNAPHWQQKTL